jgi:hypothetical protein
MARPMWGQLVSMSASHCPGSSASGQRLTVRRWACCPRLVADCLRSLRRAAEKEGWLNWLCRSRIKKKTWCMVPFAGVDYDLAFCSLPKSTQAHLPCTAKTKYRNFETNIPRKGISGPQTQYPHLCVCEWFIYSHDRSAYSAGGNM